MNEEEIVKILKDETSYICEEKEQAIQGLLDLYQKEKETSHFLQSELDQANAKILELLEERK